MGLLRDDWQNWRQVRLATPPSPSPLFSPCRYLQFHWALSVLCGKYKHSVQKCSQLLEQNGIIRWNPRTGTGMLRLHSLLFKLCSLLTLKFQFASGLTKSKGSYHSPPSALTTEMLELLNKIEFNNSKMTAAVIFLFRLRHGSAIFYFYIADSASANRRLVASAWGYVILNVAIIGECPWTFLLMRGRGVCAVLHHW